MSALTGKQHSGIRTATRSAARLGGDYGRYVTTLAFYALCWPVGRMAIVADSLLGWKTMEFMLRLSERVDEGRRE